MTSLGPDPSRSASLFLRPLPGLVPLYFGLELLLGLQPMSQYDAAANPMYASFADKPDLTPYKHLKPTTDIQARNKASGIWIRQPAPSPSEGSAPTPPR